MYKGFTEEDCLGKKLGRNAMELGWRYIILEICLGGVWGEGTGTIVGKSWLILRRFDRFLEDVL